MPQAEHIHKETTRYDHDDPSIIELLGRYGNLVFDSQPTEYEYVELAAEFLRDAPIFGSLCDIGAGEGATALALAALIDREVVAVEIVDERAVRIAERARQFGIENLEVVAADARYVPIVDYAGLYMFSPFFDAEADLFLARIAAECRAGTRIVGQGMIAKRMRAIPQFREIGSGGRWNWCTAVLDI